MSLPMLERHKEQQQESENSEGLVGLPSFVSTDASTYLQFDSAEGKHLVFGLL
jgi:hypothetical protein